MTYRSVDALIDELDDQVGSDSSEFNALLDEWFPLGSSHIKDINHGEILRVVDIKDSDHKHAEITLENGAIASIVKKSDWWLFKTINPNLDLTNWDAIRQHIKSGEYTAVVYYRQGGNIHASLRDAWPIRLKEEFRQQLKNPTKYYEARIVSRNAGGYFAEIAGVQVFLPGSLAAANKIFDFDALIGKTVNVMIVNYAPSNDTFSVSNKKYIETLLPQLVENFEFDRKYTGRVTGTSIYGVFVEFNDVFTGMLHNFKMTEETKDRFAEGGIKPGQQIEFWVEEIDSQNRFILTEYDAESRETFKNAKAVMYAEFADKYINRKIDATVIKLNVDVTGSTSGIIKFVDQPGIVSILPKAVYNKFSAPPKVGDTVTIKVLDVDQKQYKVFIDKEPFFQKHS
jgi:ribosomal protein S1